MSDAQRSSDERLSVSELTRLAFIHAEQDAWGLVEAWKGAPEAAQFENLAKQFYAYRMKRWGKTEHEARMERSTLISVGPRTKLP
jgi:hypothetical protein